MGKYLAVILWKVTTGGASVGANGFVHPPRHLAGRHDFVEKGRFFSTLKSLFGHQMTLVQTAMANFLIDFGLDSGIGPVVFHHFGVKQSRRRAWSRAGPFFDVDIVSSVDLTRDSQGIDY